MEIIPGSQRCDRTSLDALRLECFGMLLRLSFCFEGSSFDLELELGDESLVLLSSSNAASLGYFDVVGEEVKQDDCRWEISICMTGISVEWLRERVLVLLLKCSMELCGR